MPKAFNVDLAPLPDILDTPDNEFRMDLDDYFKRQNIALEEMFLRLRTLPGSGTKIEDADADTSIETENSSDEDILRFKTAGTERFIVSGSAIIPTTDDDLEIGSSSKMVKKAFLNDLGYPNETINDVIIYDGSSWVAAPSGTTYDFAMATFSDGEATEQLIGIGTWKASGAISFTATYTNGPPTSATIALTSDGGVTWASALTLTTPFTSGVSAESTSYPTTKDQYITFTITGNKSAENDTDTETVTFRNNIFHGEGTKASGYIEAEIEALTPVVSNDTTKSVALTPGASDYLVFAFPTSYAALGVGTDYETDGNKGTGFLYGGITCAFTLDSSTLSITNSAGFTENYDVYVSSLTNLGSKTLTTQSSTTALNYVYYGEHTQSGTLTEAQAEGLANSSITNDNTQVWSSVTAGASEYIWFVFPKRLGTVTFFVGGFEGGFEDPQTLSITNANGWTEDYYAYRSTQANLGATIVTTT